LEAAGRRSATAAVAAAGAAPVVRGGSAATAPPPDALHIYPYGLDEVALTAAIDSLKLGQALWITERIHDADAILALRSKVKQVTKQAAPVSLLCMLNALLAMHLCRCATPMA
jgi:hypothetical protein